MNPIVKICVVLTFLSVFCCGMGVAESYKWNKDLEKKIDEFRKQQEEMNRQRDYNLIPRIPPPTRPPLGDK